MDEVIRFPGTSRLFMDEEESWLRALISVALPRPLDGCANYALRHQREVPIDSSFHCQPTETDVRAVKQTRSSSTKRRSLNKYSQVNRRSRYFSCNSIDDSPNSNSSSSNSLHLPTPNPLFKRRTLCTLHPWSECFWSVASSATCRPQ